MVCNIWVDVFRVHTCWFWDKYVRCGIQTRFDAALRLQLNCDARFRHGRKEKVLDVAFTFDASVVSRIERRYRRA